MTRTASLGAILATIVLRLAGCGTEAAADATTELSVSGTDTLARDDLA